MLKKGTQGRRTEGKRITRSGLLAYTRRMRRGDGAKEGHAEPAYEQQRTKQAKERLMTADGSLQGMRIVYVFLCMLASASHHHGGAGPQLQF